MPLTQPQINKIKKLIVTGLTAKEVKEYLDIPADCDAEFKDVVKKAKIEKKIKELKKQDEVQPVQAQPPGPPKQVTYDESIPAPVIGATDCPVTKEIPVEQFNGATWTKPWPGAYKKFVREG